VGHHEHPLPRLVDAPAALTREVVAVDAEGRRRPLAIPLERALTLYVQRRELVTLMTLGQQPALLALGYLLNQGLLADAREVHSITCDWEVGAAAVRLHADAPDWDGRIAQRTVTTGCGQGTVFGRWLEQAPALPPPRAGSGCVTHAALVAVLETMRTLPCVYREAGSVHGTALWHDGRMLVHVEDVGRHNAVDTVAGWMAMNGISGADTLLYTTGRLTSEMVLKAARLGVPVVVSRNGITSMGHEWAARLGLTVIGRASGQRYLCYTGFERIVAGPAAAPASP
jgi:FdhD protein